MGIFNSFSGLKTEDTLFNTGVQYLKNDKYEEAISCFDELVKKNPNHAKGWFAKGQSIALQIEDIYANTQSGSDKDLYYRAHNRAIECFDKSISIDPNYPQVWGYKGLSLKAIGLDKDAVAAFDRSIALDPKSYMIYTERGSALDNLGRYEEAMQSFDRAISLNPKFFKPWFFKGMILDKLGRYEEAIENFDRALEINPNDEFGYIASFKKNSQKCMSESASTKRNNQIDILENTHIQTRFCTNCGSKIQGAKKFCTSCGAALLTPDDASLLSQKSSINKNEQHIDEKAREEAGSLVIKGSHLLFDGKRDEALICFNKAIEINPEEAGAWQQKGVIMGGLGRLDDARSCFETAIRLRSDDADTWFLKGLVIHDPLKQYDEAISCFEKAIHYNPHLVSPWYYRGHALLRIHRFDEALVCFDKTFELALDALTTEYLIFKPSEVWFYKG